MRVDTATYSAQRLASLRRPSRPDADAAFTVAPPPTARRHTRMTSRCHVTRITVEFGDCDPAGIVFYPNFFRWMDAAAWHFFRAMGIARWDDIEDSPGLIGIPLVDAGARFVRPASYGDTLEVETSVAEWRERSFVLSHVVRRDGATLVEGREVRVFGCSDPGDPKRLRAVTPPASVRRLVETEP